MMPPADNDDATFQREAWKRDWQQVELSAEFQRILERLTAWAAGAPDWTAYQSAGKLLAALTPRLREMQTNLSRVLVVALVGGSGVGKSTLINALLGEAICETGDRRPTTCQPVVLCHRAVDPSFLDLGPEPIEVHKLDLPLLEEMILVDCPDPDTEGPGSPGNRNREILRRVLPHCDVILYVGSAQKYKTQAVQQEVLRHASGRSVLFVQSRAELDHDIRDDWKASLEKIGFHVPPIFYLDSELALAGQRQNTETPAEFQRLRRHLHFDIAHRARHRIKRANVLDLLNHLVGRMRADVQQQLQPVVQLRNAIELQRGELFVKVQRHIGQQLRAHRRLWQNRLAGQVTSTWGGGLFTGLLRLFASAGSLLNLLLLTRARTPVQLLVAGGVTAGRVVGGIVSHQQETAGWITAADLGIGDADLIRSDSIVRGFAREAAISSPGNPTITQHERSSQQLGRVAQQLYAQMEAAIDRAVEEQVARRAGRIPRFFSEGLLAALLGYILFLLGRNFFYEVPYRGLPLLGIDFFVHAAVWIVVAAWALRWWLMRRLGRGLSREIGRLVDELPEETILGPLYADLEAACLAIQQHAETLRSLEADVQQLRSRFGTIEGVDIGKIDTAAIVAAADY